MPKLPACCAGGWLEMAHYGTGKKTTAFARPAVSHTPRLKPKSYRQLWDPTTTIAISRNLGSTMTRPSLTNGASNDGRRANLLCLLRNGLTRCSPESLSEEQWEFFWQQEHGGKLRLGEEALQRLGTAVACTVPRGLRSKNSSPVPRPMLNMRRHTGGYSPVVAASPCCW